MIPRLLFKKLHPRGRKAGQNWEDPWKLAAGSHLETKEHFMALMDFHRSDYNWFAIIISRIYHATLSTSNICCL